MKVPRRTEVLSEVQLWNSPQVVVFDGGIHLPECYQIQVTLTPSFDFLTALFISLKLSSEIVISGRT